MKIDIDKLSVSELKKIQKQINKKLQKKTQKTKTYYMHSMSCNIDNNEIRNFVFTNNERCENLTPSEFKSNDFYLPYYDDHYTFDEGIFHVSLYTDKKTATPEERISLEKLFFKEINEYLFKKINDDIDNYKKDIIDIEKKIRFQKKMKTTQKAKITTICKNYLRIEKLKRLEDEG